MIRKVVFGFAGLFSMLAITLSFFRNTLVLSEYSQTSFSELIYYSPLTLVIIFCVFVSAFFIVLGILLHIKPSILLKKKQLVVVCSTILVSALFITIVGAIYSISSAKQIERSKNVFDFVEEQPNEEIPSEYEFVLPFLTDINDYYSFKTISTKDAKYLHTQNYGSNEKSMIVYDVEFFKSENRSLLQQYVLQKTEPAVKSGSNLTLKGETKVVEGVKCIAYQQDNYLQIRIIENDNYFSIVFDNLYTVSDCTVTDFEKIAVEIYLSLRDQSND